MTPNCEIVFVGGPRHAERTTVMNPIPPLFIDVSIPRPHDKVAETFTYQLVITAAEFATLEGRFCYVPKCP